MKHYFLFILLSAAIATGGCTEELKPETSGTNGAVPDEGELTEAVLNLSVNAFVVEAQAETRASIPSGTPEQETPEEKEIHDIWVFQYDAAAKELLIKPRYYTITDQAMLQDLPVYLKAGVPSVVYAVTNTGYDNWANDGTDAAWQKFRQLEQLKKQTLPTAFPLRSIDKVSIPMAGASEEVEVTTRYYGHSAGYAHVRQTQSKGRDAEGGDETEQRQRKANPEYLPGRDLGRRRQ